MSTISVEIARAKSLNGAKESSFKGVVPRTNDRNSLKSGDVFTIPENWVALEQPIRGAKPRKDTVTGKMITPTAKYLFVEVVRDGKTLVVAFYPSAFWKRRRLAEEVADPDDDTKTIFVNSDDYRSASGTACEFVQGYADLEEALNELAKDKKKIAVTRNEILTLPYETEQSSNRSDCEDSVLDMNFVD